MIHRLPFSKGTCVQETLYRSVVCVCLVCAVCVYMRVCVGGAQHAGGHEAIGAAVCAKAIIHQP